MNMYYGDDVDYARKRLERTIITHEDGNLAYIMSIDDDFRVQHALITAEAVEVKDWQSIKNFDLTPINLGFSNSPTKNTAAYICRKPMRRDWKQGVSDNNTIFCGVGDQVLLHAKLGSQFTNVLSRFYQPHFNKYPSLIACLKTVSKNGTSVAFSRAFCITNQGGRIDLFYKTTPVGKVEGDQPRLDPKFFYLQELLEEAVNG